MELISKCSGFTDVDYTYLFPLRRKAGKREKDPALSLTTNFPSNVDYLSCMMGTEQPS